jgi:predicted phage terminase large subunit-like protein
MSSADDFIRHQLIALAMKSLAHRTGQGLEPHAYLKYTAWHLEQVASGQSKRLVVALPPRHAKTLLVSTAFPAWVLGHNPAAKFLLLSYGQELADKIAYEIRAIMQSDWYRRIFKTRIDKHKVSDFVTTAGGGVRSVSIEGGVTGLGADFIVVDDPAQIKDADNDKKLDRVNALFDAEIRTRLNNPKKGAIVIVAHRLAENDLPGHVIQEGGWKLVRLPLIAPRARTYKTDDGLVWSRHKGELLRPDAFTPRDIERLRRAKRPNFETLQQQNPGRRDRLRIRAEQIGVFTREEIPTDVPIVVSIDPGQKGGPANSYGVIQAWAVHGRSYFLCDQFRDQVRYNDFRAEVSRFIRRHRPSIILIEATGQGPALISQIKPQAGMEIVSITPVGDKVSRLRRHQKTICAGSIRLPEHALWRNEFLVEVALFPYAEFDDQVDAMSQFLDWIAVAPPLVKRPPRAIAAGTSSRGVPLAPQVHMGPTLEVPGAVLVQRRRSW